MEPMMGTCKTCGIELPESVLDAADLMYGPSGVRVGEGLREALRRATKVNDTDEGTGQKAVLEALGLDDFQSIAQAYKHYGQFGECRR